MSQLTAVHDIPCRTTHQSLLGVRSVVYHFFAHCFRYAWLSRFDRFLVIWLVGPSFDMICMMLGGALDFGPPNRMHHIYVWYSPSCAPHGGGARYPTLLVREPEPRAQIRSTLRLHGRLWLFLAAQLLQLLSYASNMVQWCTPVQNDHPVVA